MERNNDTSGSGMTDMLTSSPPNNPEADVSPSQFLFGIPRKVVARAFAALARAGVVEPLATLCTRAIQVHTPGPKGAITLLALNTGRFRGDLECLAATGKFRILTVPFLWQGRLYRYFYNPGERSIEARSRPEIMERQRLSRIFFRKFLRRLYSRLNVDAVIGASFLYLQDYDWGAVTHEIGVPYLVFMREGNVASAFSREAYAAWGRRLEEFEGTFLVTQNELQRSALIETGFISAGNSAAAGIMRMDRLVTNANPKRARRRGGKKRVAFFSFGPGTTILGSKPPHWPHQPEKYLLNFCKNTHVAVARFAVNNPDVEVVFKPIWGGWWLDKIRELVQSAGIEIDSLPNVSIQPKADVHKLLDESDLVVGYGSTVLLEAAISGLPVILPLFDEIVEPRFQDNLMYAEDLDCFDIADSPEALEEMIGARILSPAIAPGIQELRGQTFEKYVSRLDGRATERYSDIILSQVRLRRELSG